VTLAKDIVGDEARDSIKSVLADPALLNIESVASEWIQPILEKSLTYFRDETPSRQQRTLARWKSMIVRNLFFQHQAITREAVLKELDRILKIRHQLSSKPLFSRKNIVFLAHEEKNRAGESVF
jgi:hypothetical protein